MKTPIITVENGDVCFFSNVEDAATYLEPIDIKNEEYEIYDSEAMLLNAIPTEPKITILELDEKIFKKDHLTEAIKEFFIKIGLDVKGLNEASLEDLIKIGIKEYPTK